MNRHRPEHLDLCAAWVLGSIDEGDRLELEAHLADGCATCDAEIAILSEGTRALAASTPVLTPAPALRGATLARVRAAMAEAEPSGETERPTNLPRHQVRRPRFERPARPWFGWGMAAAAASLAVVAGILWQSRTDLRTELSGARRTVADLEKALESERAWAKLFASQDLRAVQFSATPDAIPALRARGIWDPKSQRAVLVFELPTTPANHDYQLWGIHPTGPASLGLVRADEQGRSVVRLEGVASPETLQAFAISLEPLGGSPNPNAPTGPVIMVGSLGG